MSSSLQGKVGAFDLVWKSAPRGNSGSSVVQIGTESIEVHWRKDNDGIWIELPYGVYGFDFSGELNDQGNMVFRISERGRDGLWSEQAFIRAGAAAVSSQNSGKKKGIRVRAQMPGKIVRVMVQPGASVEKDQPVIVMEAMKMENEIRAPHAGIVDQVKVTEGQAVESGADLLTLA